MISNFALTVAIARTAVHFQAVAERYAPYETILEISHPDELSDTALAASFPLHTASPALSNTRLDEISEDAEDGGSASFGRLPARNGSNKSAKFGTARYKTERRVDQLMRAQHHRPASPLRGETSPVLSSSPPSTSVKPSISQFLVREDAGTRSVTSLTPSIGSVTEYAESSADSDGSTAKETETIPSTVELHQVEIEPTERNVTPSEPAPVAKTPSIREPSPEPEREEPAEQLSSHVEPVRATHVHDVAEEKSTPDLPKPLAEEPFDFSYLEPKPKIKLGPRPVVTLDKPRKSGNMGTSPLPAGYLAKKQEQQRPKSFGATNLAQAQAMSGLGLFPAPPPIPNLPEYNPRPVSRGSVKSMPSQKTTAMTPEKLRLMKAVEMRKNKMRKSNPQIRAPISSDPAPDIPKMPENTEAEKIVETFVQTSSELDESKKLDSGIAMEHLPRAETNKQSRAKSPKHSLDGAREVELKEPAGLLSPPAVDEEPKPQQAQDAMSVDNAAIPGEPMLSIQQLAGADEFPLPPKGSPRRSGSRRASRRSRRSSPLSTENAQSESVPMPSAGKTSEASAAIDQNVDESAMSTSFENLITDVPAIVTTASSRPQSANEEANVSRDRSQSPYGSREPASGATSGTLTPSDEAFRQMSELAQRRRGLVEPLHIDVDTRRSSVAESLSDNDLLEELQSATFHDAKEMLVSKSPGPSGQILPAHLARSISHDSSASQSRSPVRSINIASGISHPEVSLDQQLQQSTERSNPVSHEQAQQTQPQLESPSSSAFPVDRCGSSASQRRVVSSGITRRIQALNDLSNREPSAVPVHIPTRGMSPDPAPVFLAQERRPSMRSPHSRTGSSYLRAKTDRAASVPSGNNQPESSHVWNTSHDATSNRDSVSVKARIVRPPTAGSTEASPDSANDLHESQIEINHSRGMPTPNSVSQAFLPPMPSPPTNPPSPDLRSLSSLRRKSLGRSKASTPGPVPVNDENRSGAATPTSTEEQGISRTSRFFKRMSTFGSNASKRRSIASPILPSVGSPNPETSSSRTGSVSTTAANVLDRDTPPAVQVGDLNVQFPDTLVSSPTPKLLPPQPILTGTNQQLWKRRWLSLDESGYLHLSPPTSQQPSQSQSRPGKKFHLSDFKAPYAPDLDQQELPHSICLEFTGSQAPDTDAFDGDHVDGGVLQLACEDAMGQRQVLRLLGGYWKSWVV
jgi:hypothetical protein